MTEYRAGEGTPVSTWDIYVEQPNRLPAYLEVEPDSFVPIGRASKEQLTAAAERLEKNAASLVSLAEKFRLLAEGEIPASG